MDDIIERLKDQSLQLARRSFDSVDAGLAANVADAAIDEIERLREELRTHHAQGAPNPAAQFVMWALMEGSWQGADIDGGAVQDKAEALGLITVTAYDPEKHGESDSAEPGDSWYVPSETLLAAVTSPTRCRFCDEVVEPGHDCSVAPAGGAS